LQYNIKLLNDYYSEKTDRTPGCRCRYFCIAKRAEQNPRGTSKKESREKQTLTIELDKLKLDIGTEEEHRNDLQSKQAMVKKNNEYQALTKEIKGSADKEKSLNTSLEKKNTALEANSAAFSEQQAQAEKIKSELLKEAAKAKKEITVFEQKINKYKLLRKEIEKDIISLQKFFLFIQFFLKHARLQL